MNKSAQRLGRMARGVPKSFSPEQRQARRELMLAINARRRQAKENAAKPVLPIIAAH